MLLLSDVSAITFLVLATVHFGSCKLDESVIRTASKDYVSDGQILRQYSDGRDTVVAIFTAKNEILECHVEKSDPNATQQLFNQAVLNPLHEKQYLFQEDVARLGRRCKKMIRDIVSRNL